MFWLILALHSFTSLNAQFFYHHDTEIKYITCDSLGHILFQDEIGDGYVMHNHEVHSFEKKLRLGSSVSNNRLVLKGTGFYRLDKFELVQLSKEDLSGFNEVPFYAFDSLTKEIKFSKGAEIESCSLEMDSLESFRLLSNGMEHFLLFKNRLKGLCLDFDLVLPFNATDVWIGKDEMIFSSSNKGIWTYRNNELRKFYSPGLILPLSISNLRHTGDALWILTRDNYLYKYEFTSQTIREVSRQVTDFCFDQWNMLWMAKENRIESDSRFVNSNQIYTKIKSISQSGEKIEFGERAVLKYTDPFDLELSEYYSPSPSSISHQYRLLPTGEWIDYIHGISIPVPSPGIYTLEIRSGFKEGIYRNTDSLLIKVEQSLSKTYWPYILGAMAVLLFLVGIGIQRQKRISERLKKERKQLELKLKLLEKEQQVGQSQMNPHFFVQCNEWNKWFDSIK